LISEARLVQSPCLDWAPTELAHQFGQPSARARPAASLRNFQDVEHGLCADALNAVVTDFAAQAF
jgi:hypothetical protein